MYFPYLRCKQFELIALRELLRSGYQYKNKISPILEPVKIGGNNKLSSTFHSTIQELVKKDVNFNLIINPRVGDFSKNNKLILEFVKEVIVPKTQNFQCCIIKDPRFNKTNFNEEMQDNELLEMRFSVIHSMDKMIEFAFEPKYHIINYQKVSKRYHRNFRGQSIVSLDDYFDEETRNADYLGKDPSFFSDEFKFYKEDNFSGFSDYLTIGENYSETGFMPFAVAIHISYIPKDNPDTIFIKHFTSENNEDRTDVAQKFEQALNKLVYWVEADNIEKTQGITEFLDLHERRHFPGLGVIKKLSIKNHIELVTKNMVR